MRLFKLFVLLGCLFLVACSAETEQAENGEIEGADLEPVTIKMWHWMGEETFNKFYKEPVEEKFDNITLELVSGGPDKTSIEELLAKGENPDIIWGGTPWQLQLFDEYNLTGDMTELIEKTGYEYDHLDAGGIRDVSNFFRPGEFNAFPYIVPRMVLHYNKDIFDLFGEEYPVDDMTWGEVIDLAKRVTGERNGTRYYGVAGDFTGLALGAHKLDKETDEPILSKSKEWMRALTAIDEIYSIPGNLPDELSADAFNHGAYFDEGTLAMEATWFKGYLADSESLNWDIVTYPVWEGEENKTPLLGSQWLGLSETSENPGEAFKVLTYLVSEERLILEYTGSTNILNIPLENIDTVQSIEPHQGLESINYISGFKHELVTPPSGVSKYEGTIGNLPSNKIPELIIFGNDDINTAVKKMEEWASQQVLEAKGAK